MDTGRMDIGSFFEARLAEREHCARHAMEYSGATWSCPSTGVIDLGVADGDLGDLIPTGNGPVAYHVADNDPAYVLADVAAKRAILKAWLDTDDGPVTIGGFRACSDSCPEDVLYNVIRLHVAPFADHPDFDTRWIIASVSVEVGQ